MKYLEPIDTAFDPLDYPPPGPVGGYSQRPACIYVDSHTRPAPAVSIPDAPTATDAFRWLRERFGGRRFTWAAAIPGARMTICKRGGFRKVVAVFVRDPDDTTARWRPSKSTPAAEPIHLETSR